MGSGISASPALSGTPRSVATPFARKLAGAVIIVAAPVVAILLFVAAWQLMSGQLLVVTGGVLAMLAAYSVSIGRRMRMPTAWEVLESDPRPPVIFLRPFQEDERLKFGQPIGPRTGGISTGPSDRSRATYEPKIARALGRVGPFVAVGRPGEKLPPFGAARLYVGDDQWQDVVTDLVTRASAVVLQPDASPGTVWEIQLVARIVDPRRLLLLVPNPAVRPLGFDRVRDLAINLLCVRIPSPATCPPCNGFVFDETRQGTPVLLESHAADAIEPFCRRAVGLGAAAS